MALCVSFGFLVLAGQLSQVSWTSCAFIVLAVQVCTPGLDCACQVRNPLWSLCLALATVAGKLYDITLHYIVLQYIALHCITLRYVTLRYATLRYVTLRYVRYVSLRCVT